MPLSTPPKVFISYAWEEEPHPTWVRDFATRLRKEDGLDVTLDQWAAQPGDELTFFMEKSVHDSRFVLLICTPTYKAKFDTRHGGVGYEATSITGEILAGLAKRRVIPVHRNGRWAEAAPSIMLGSFYINLTGDPFKETEYRALVDTLKGRREIAPAIGHGDTVFEGPGAVPARPVANFSGRAEELKLLLAHLRSPDETAVCVVVLGIAGVGKTALVRQLVATLAAGLFPGGSAWLDGTNLVSELARVSRRFGWPEPTEPTPEQATTFLMNQLHDRPVLLVVDNLPADMDSTHISIPGGKSRTLITSRTVSLAQDLGVPTKTIHLEHWPPETSRSYLREVVPRLVGEPDTDLDGLSGFVQGLPLAVRLIARALLRNVARSARQHLARLKDEPLGTLDQVASGSDRGVAATFLEAYRTLSPDQQRVLCVLAACAQGTRAEIVAAVAGSDTSAADDFLSALVGVSLAEFREGAECPWGLHDVVRMFVRAQSAGRDAQSAHLAWVRNHLRRHVDPLAHESLEEGIAEAVTAFELLLARREHDQASDLLLPIYQHLTRRGRYAAVINLVDRLLESLEAAHNMEITATWLGNLGLCYQTLGDIPKAIDLHQRSLALEERLGGLRGQAGDLGNLGICYQTLSNIPKAIDFHQRALAIEERLGRLEGQASQLGNLGLCYQTLSDIPKAINFHQRALAIEEELGRLSGQASDLGNLGLCYLSLRDIPTAIEFIQRCLAMNEELGALEGQAFSLGNLGICYRELGDIPKAIEFLQRCLAMNEELDALEGQASSLGNLGGCYQMVGDLPKAIEFRRRSLAMNEKLGHLEGQASSLGNIGLCYHMLDDIPKSVDFIQRSLAIFQTMGLAASHPSVAVLQRTLATVRSKVG